MISCRRAEAGRTCPCCLRFLRRHAASEKTIILSAAIKRLETSGARPSDGAKNTPSERMENMKKLFAILLSALIFAQGAAFALDEPKAAEGTNIATGKNAFSYNSAADTNCGMALDGDPDTAWISAGAYGLHDQFVIDLGAAFTISTIGILPASETSAQHFTVYGAKHATDTKTSLVSVGTELTSTETMTMLDVADAGEYRYLIFDQISGQEKLGFAEIEVYTPDASPEENAQKGAARLISKGKTILASNDARYNNMTTIFKKREMWLDDDPSGFDGASAGAGSPIRVMLDLGEPTALSYVAYQLAGAGAYLPEDNCANFKVVASETLNGPFNMDDFDVIAEVNGSPALDGTKSTGLMVFEVPEELRANKYRYVGFVKLVDTINRFAVSTIQVYANGGGGDIGGGDEELGPDDVTNVAVDKAAMAYGSAAGSAPYMAVDGDPDTAWISTGANGFHDQLLIDLGASYPVAALGVLPVSGDSARSFTVYGANDAMQTDKKALLSVGTEISDASQMSFLPTGQSDSFRYIIIDQISGQPALGFSEFAVYTPNEFAGEAADSGKVSIMSVGKKSFMTNVSTSNDVANLPIATKGDRTGLTDSDPTMTYGFTGSALCHIFLDLGASVPLSHVAYQAKVPGSADYMLDNAANFLVVATNNADFKSGDYEVIGQVGTPKLDGQNNTGLLVFPVSEAQRGKTYRYVGIVKPKPTLGAITRLSANTIQVYTKADDIVSHLKGQNRNALAMDEKTSVTDSALSYSANVLNGEGTRSLTAMFGRVGQDGAYGETAYAAGQLTDSGAYNALSLSADKAAGLEERWELVLMDGLQPVSYISDMTDGTKPGDWTGAHSLESAVKQVGNAVTVSGKAGAPFVGMMILKPGAAAESYTPQDILTHQLIPAAADATGAWDYQFAYTLPDEAPSGEYLLGVFCDGGYQTFPIQKIDVDAVVQDFAGVTAENFAELLNKHRAFFGELAEELAAGTKMGESFMLAKEGFTKGQFDSAHTSWAESGTITAAAEAALVIDATLNQEKFQDEIEPYISAMPLIFTEDYDADEFEELLAPVLKYVSVTSAENLTLAYRRAIGLSLIANGELKERERAVAEYGKDLGIKEETMGGRTAREIASKLDSSMETVKNSYAGGMDSIVRNIVEELDDSDSAGGGKQLGSGGGSGGGGSRGGSMRVPSNPIEYIPEQSGQTEETGHVSFTDIGQHAWAESAIAMLTERGILNGRGDGSFDPDGLLTREEAVKMLVLSVGVVTEQTDNGYRDCEVGSWYYPYITAAKANELVNGFSRTEFGIGSFVTRQDLAVMLYRAMQKQGMIRTTEQAEFTDGAQIADYAQEAVSTLGAMEIITGFTDGSFAPGQNATRAQAAVIFGRFLSLADADGAGR